MTLPPNPAPQPIASLAACLLRSTLPFSRSPLTCVLRYSQAVIMQLLRWLLFTALTAAPLVAEAADPTPVQVAAPTSGLVMANGIKLHYLDWGGQGDTLLFLAGFEDTSHVYDHFAPPFTDHFHVLGLTRRGCGESDKPATGYDTSTRVEDIHGFLDALKISKVSLLGHSMAGDELTLFASRYPERVNKLVYYEAAYDRTPEGWLDGMTDPAYEPGKITKMRLEALGRSEEAARIQVKDLPPPDAWAIRVATHRAVFAFRPDYTRVQAPALAFYAVTASRHYPASWLPDDADAAYRAREDAWWQAHGHWLRQLGPDQLRRQIPHGEVVEYEDASHYLFTGRTAKEVAQRTREFLLR